MKRRWNIYQGPKRDELLKEALGKERYTTASQLMLEVKEFKHAMLTRKCLFKYKIGSSSGQQSIPYPVRLLFFQTSLIKSYETASLDSVTSLDWNSMIAQAKQNIQSYKEWELEANSK
jgi:hypothetical protein